MPEGYKVVGMSCNGNKPNFYLQSTLISVTWSKHILGLTTSLIANKATVQVGTCRPARNAEWEMGN